MFLRIYTPWFGFLFLSCPFPFPAFSVFSFIPCFYLPLFPLDASIFSRSIFLGLQSFSIPPYSSLYFLFTSWPLYPSPSHPLSIHFSIPSILIPDWFSDPFSCPRGRGWWSLGPITGFLRENLRGKRTGRGGGWRMVRWKRWIREFRGLDKGATPF